MQKERKDVERNNLNEEVVKGWITVKRKITKVGTCIPKEKDGGYGVKKSKRAKVGQILYQGKERKM